MSFVSLHLSTVTLMFPIPNFQFFTTLYLSLTHTSIIYLSFAMLYLPMYILDMITPSSTAKKKKKKKINSTQSPP